MTGCSARRNSLVPAFTELGSWQGSHTDQLASIQCELSLRACWGRTTLVPWQVREGCPEEMTLTRSPEGE